MKPIIGVDLGGTNVRAGRVEGQKIAAHASMAISSRSDDAQKVIDEISATIERVMVPDIAGIGIGVPSLVDVEHGIVYSVENIPCWREVRLKELLEKRFHVPVHVNNDANCFALGELHFGKGHGARHMIGMVIGTGLGAGVIVNGHLYSGANCGAGEIGTVPYKEHTIEYYASGSAFANVYGVKGGGAELFDRASQGDLQALEIFTQYGHEVAHAMMTTLYAFDPEVVVLGGSVPQSIQFWEKSMRKTLESYAYPHALKRTKILVSQEPQIAILGAAGLVLDACKYTRS